MNSIRHTEHDKSFRSVLRVAVARQRSCPTSFCFDDNEEAGPSDWAGTAYWTRTLQTPVPARRSGGAKPRAKSAPQLKAQCPIQIIAAVYLLSKRERERKWRRRWRMKRSKKPPPPPPTHAPPLPLAVKIQFASFLFSFLPFRHNWHVSLFFCFLPLKVISDL